MLQYLNIAFKEKEKNMSNIFREIEAELKECWKIQYLGYFNGNISKKSETEIDDWQAKKCCEAYLLRYCDDKDFTEEILKIYGKWDIITKSCKYSGIEQKIGKHFCNFWKCHDDKTQCIGDKTFRY